MVVRTNQMRGFPVVTAQAFEGTLTRYTTGFSETGGQSDVAVYQYPIEKGDLVVLYQHTENGEIQVKAAVGDDNIVHGMAVSSPFGVDNTTSTSGTPDHTLQRRVDVAFFGIGIIELVVSATGAVEPGDIVGLDADEVNEVETQIAHDGSITVGTNGGFVALSYGAAGQYIPILVGTSLFVGN